MLLTLSTTRTPATDLGWLLHKHPAKVQAFPLAFGTAYLLCSTRYLPVGPEDAGGESADPDGDCPTTDAVMKRMTLDVYSKATNRAVIRPPGRRFPGLVIQGDTLSALVKRARELLESARRLGHDDLIDQAEGLSRDLDAFVKHYERVLARHGIDLPYTGPLGS